MKLNAQIEVLNKTIDKQNVELHELQNINTELKHYWRNTFLVGFGVAFIILLIEIIISQIH